MMKIKRLMFPTLVICGIILFLILISPPAFSADTYKWKMTSFAGAGPPINALPKKFIEVINERTNGAVEITLFENTLGSAKDHWEMLEKGATQMAYLSEGHSLGRMPVACLLNLPFELSDLGLIYDLCVEWMEAGYLKEITDHFKVLFYRPTNSIDLFLRDKKVTKMEDFRGLKIRALQGMQGRTVTALGAASVSMHGSELYMNLSTGVIDGLLTGPDYVYAVKLHEIAKYGLRWSFYTGLWLACMNKKVWDDLPKNLQNTIETVSHELWKEERTKVVAGERAAWDDLQNKTKMEIYTIDPEEQARWRKATSTIANEYLDEWSAKGYPVKEAYAMMKEKAKTQN
jgi:TRAP-type C4-dicarboxylate transport system substrate-binding protein